MELEWNCTLFLNILNLVVYRLLLDRLEYLHILIICWMFFISIERLFAKPIILPSVKQSMKLGGSYELKCTVISEKPLTVNWVRSMGRRGKDAVLASIPAKLDKYIYTYSYVISKVSSEDSGIYWCIARNSVGNSRRKFLVQVEVWWRGGNWQSIPVLVPDNLSRITRKCWQPSKIYIYAEHWDKWCCKVARCGQKGLSLH